MMDINKPQKVGVVVIVLIILVIFVRLVGSEINYVKATLDNNDYLVRNLPDNKQAANMLAQIKQNIHSLINYLNEHHEQFKEYQEYLTQLNDRIKNVVISESSDDNQYTSYSVNKGEEIVFCLRSRVDKNKFHGLNLIMYVALHELAHVACPEFGHTPLFKKIFSFLTTIGINIGIYHKIDFDSHPTEYCGLTIADSIV